MPARRYVARLRLAAALVLFGLATQLVTLSWASPAAFLVFALLGTPLLCAGVLVYLWTIARVGEPPLPDAGPERDAPTPPATDPEPSPAR